MGIRIKKYIGYYLKNKNIEELFNENIHSLRIESKVNINNIIIKYEEMKKHCFMNYNAELLFLAKNNDFIEKSDIITTIFYGDKEEGLLFTTPSMKHLFRNDDTIDYYENREENNFKIRYIESPIHPEDFYICIKKPDFTTDSINYYMDYINVNKERYEINEGDVINRNDIHCLNIKNEINTVNKEKEWCFTDNEKSKYFHPYINPLIYLYCLEAKFFKKEISYIDFIKKLDPVIITTWF